MNVAVQFQGLKELEKKLKDRAEGSEGVLTQALVACAFRIQRTAKKSIQTSPPDPATGRSSPGNPPKTDTGALVNSIYVDVEDKDGKTQALVGTNLKYGKDLEFGTRDIAARPWLFPAFEANFKKNVESVKAAVAKFMKTGRSQGGSGEVA